MPFLSYILSVLSAISIVVLVPSACAATGRDPVVQAPAGTVQGVRKGGLHIFKNIPYALPPVGSARWKAPMPMPAWDGVRETTNFGPACIQPKSRAKSIYSVRYKGMSEDCLSLNIWAPENAKNAPVFVWIYGGSLTAGANSDPMYDGAKFAKQGIIFVSINYRLGVLGYMAHPALSQESPDQISGNYGLLDQIAALKWVKGNIASFGGNAENVTIAGESAGALSVMYLMTSPLARGLFDKAVAQSAYMVTTPHLKEKRFGMPSAEAVGTWLAGKFGSQDIDELRAMDAATMAGIAKKEGFFPFGAIDGHVLPGQLVDVFDRGEQARVPILAGFNSGEIRSLRFLLPPAPSNASDYEKEIRARYGDLADVFLKHYPTKNIGESMLATTRDAMYGWTAERLAAKQSVHDIPAYLYLFDHGYPEAQKYGLHAFHASEIPYVFGTEKRTPKLWPKIPKQTADIKLSAAMLDYWTSFARTGRPVATDQPDWYPYGIDKAYMYFADKPYLAKHLLPGVYELHEEVMCRRRATGEIAWNWNVGVVSPPLPSQTESCQ